LVFLKKDNKKKGFQVLDGEEGKIKILKEDNSKAKIPASNSAIEDIKSQIKKIVNKE